MNAEISISLERAISNSIHFKYLAFRRYFELLFIALISPLVLIIVLITIIAIKVNSRGPVLIKQKRFGINHSEFIIYKFRTMVHINGCLHFKSYDAAKITKVGKFLRKHRIDELPQIMNIIKGDMSLFAPRPDYIDEHSLYEREVLNYNKRLAIKPGITGWAQVYYGHSHDIISAKEKLEYDLFYINNISFKNDLKIFFRTFLVLCNGFGAR